MFEILFIRDLKPTLNKQKDLIRCFKYFVHIASFYCFYFFISIVFSLVYFSAIFSYISTPPLPSTFILIMVSSRHRNLDNFIALTFITKVFKTKFLIRFWSVCTGFYAALNLSRLEFA